MDMSFGVQALSILHIAEHGKELEPKLYPVPAEVDRRVAVLALEAAGICIDSLSEGQRQYMASWQTGTA